MLFRIIFSLVISSLLLTACGGGSGSKAKKKLSCTSTHAGDLMPSCDTDTAKLINGVTTLDIIKGKRTETISLNCKEGNAAGTSIANYNTGEVGINVSGTNGTVSCKMYFPAPLVKTITTQEDIDTLLEWGDDPANRTSTNCPPEILDNDSSDITEDMIQACSGSVQVDFEFTDSNLKDHSLTLKYTIK